MARRRRAGQQTGRRCEVLSCERRGAEPLLQLRDAARRRRRLVLVRGGAQRDLVQRVAALRRQRRQQLQCPLRRCPSPAAVAAATAAAARLGGERLKESPAMVSNLDVPSCK